VPSRKLRDGVQHGARFAVQDCMVTTRTTRRRDSETEQSKRERVRKSKEVA